MTEESKPRPSRPTTAAIEPAWERLFELGSGADVLLRAGLLAQSYRLASQQLAEIAAQIESAAPTQAQAQPVPALTARNHWVQRALAELRSLPLPSHDGEFTEAHGRALREALAAGAAWLRATEKRSSQARLRLRRGALIAALVALLALTGLIVLFPRALQVNVSGRYSSEFEGTNVVDGSTSSEWLLPDAQLGWVELRFRNPRMLHNVRIRNAVNRHYRDRATRNFRLEIFRADQRLGSFHGEFPPIGSGDPTLTFPIAARSADRVLVSVESFYGLGGGIAEIQLD